MANPFITMFDRFRPKIERIIYFILLRKRCHPSYVMEDYYNEVLLHLLNKQNQILSKHSGGELEFNVYLRKVVINKCLEIRRNLISHGNLDALPGDKKFWDVPIEAVEWKLTSDRFDAEIPQEVEQAFADIFDAFERYLKYILVDKKVKFIICLKARCRMPVSSADLCFYRVEKDKAAHINELLYQINVLDGKRIIGELYSPLVAIFNIIMNTNKSADSLYRWVEAGSEQHRTTLESARDKSPQEHEKDKTGHVVKFIRYLNQMSPPCLMKADDFTSFFEGFAENRPDFLHKVLHGPFITYKTKQNKNEPHRIAFWTFNRRRSN